MAGDRLRPVARLIVVVSFAAALVAGTSGTSAARRCGDGFPDPGEECDQGQQNGATCCDTSCRWRPSGALCIPVSGSACQQGLDTGPRHRCTTDVCRHGQCVHPEKECPATGDKCLVPACDPESGACGSKPSRHCKSGKAG